LDLIKNLLVADPEKRYSLKDVIDSEWYNKKFASSGEVSPDFESP
jgi:hypothetical protein